MAPATEHNEPAHGSVTFWKPVRQGPEGRLLPSSAPEGAEAEAGVLLFAQHPCQRQAGRTRRTIVGARRGLRTSDKSTHGAVHSRNASRLLRLVGRLPITLLPGAGLTIPTRAQLGSVGQTAQSAELLLRTTADVPPAQQKGHYQLQRWMSLSIALHPTWTGAFRLELLAPRFALSAWSQ